MAAASSTAGEQQGTCFLQEVVGKPQTVYMMSPSTIANESKERKEAQTNVDEAMEAIGKRLTRLESDDNHKPESNNFDNDTANNNQQGGWQVQHIILEVGWAMTRGRASRCRRPSG